MAMSKDLSLATAMWTDEFWYPDTSIGVDPPINPSDSPTKTSIPAALVLGKVTRFHILTSKIWMTF